MADFAALGRTHATSFTGCERRHVVVHQETVTVLTHERINDLLVLLSAECRDDKRLCLTARKQRATVHTWQYTQTDFDWANSASVTTIDTWLSAQNLTADDFGFEIEQNVVDRHAIGRGDALGGCGLGELGVNA